MEDEGRKQAEADEAARSMTKTHHLEVQEVKAQRRAELYRLNGSLADGLAAMQTLTTALDTYQAQVQGTMCAVPTLRLKPVTNDACAAD